MNQEPYQDPDDKNFWDNPGELLILYICGMGFGFVVGVMCRYSNGIGKNW